MVRPCCLLWARQEGSLDEPVGRAWMEIPLSLSGSGAQRPGPLPPVSVISRKLWDVPLWPSQLLRVRAGSWHACPRPAQVTSKQQVSTLPSLRPLQQQQQQREQKMTPLPVPGGKEGPLLDPLLSSICWVLVWCGASSRVTCEWSPPSLGHRIHSAPNLHPWGTYPSPGGREGGG